MVKKTEISRICMAGWEDMPYILCHTNHFQNVRVPRLLGICNLWSGILLFRLMTWNIKAKALLEFSSYLKLYQSLEIPLFCLTVVIFILLSDCYWHHTNVFMNLVISSHQKITTNIIVIPVLQTNLRKQSLSIIRWKKNLILQCRSLMRCENHGQVLVGLSLIPFFFLFKLV